MNSKSCLFYAIKSHFPYSDSSCPNDIPEDVILSSYDIAKKQDMGHFFASVAENLNNDTLKSQLKKQNLLAVFRREQINFEEARIFKLFDENGIDYIPLKGSVIKSYYPEEWMRLSSDTDILVPQGQCEKATRLLTQALKYSYQGKSTKDIQLFSESGVHIELHYSPLQDNEKTDKLLARIWDYAKKSHEDSHRYDLSPEFLVFHTVAHALYHFIAGGCGIKPILDLWVLEQTAECNKELLNQLFEEAQITRFYEELINLSRVWFGNQAHTKLTEMMEEYIFNGGVYGNRENLGSAKVYREGGKTKYLFSRIFKPKKELALQYPSLEKRPFLLPFYQIKRWFNLLDKKRRNDVVSEAKGGFKSNNTANLFRQLEI